MGNIRRVQRSGDGDVFEGGPSLISAGSKRYDWPRSSRFMANLGCLGGPGTLMALMHLVHITPAAGWAGDPPGTSR